MRQIARRSRGHVAERRARYDADPALHRALIERFMAATASGDVTGLLRLLAPEVTVRVDTDGKVRGAPKPIRSADKVARFFASTPARTPDGVTVTYEPVNGVPGAVVRLAGKPISVVAVDLAGGRIAEIYWVANPAKLTGYSGRRG